ncbi:DUF6086 family protein [Streptomyces polygonati]|uniref:DUF6086 family protein n=1 Tax=Streptomyces polygonati TaxID=1617087 RepID=A0ABV8HMS3_9ACTN
MSYIFEVEGDWVWTPANRPGRLYVGMADAAAAVLGLPTGLETDSGDTYEIDVPAFGAFVGGMLTLRASSGHLYLNMMLDGILPLSVAILYRAGGSLSPATPDERDLLVRIRAMDLPMTGA